MDKKSQQGIALVWIILAGALFITGVEIALISHTQKRTQDTQQVPQPVGVKKEAGERGGELVGKIEAIIVMDKPVKCTYAQEGFTGISFIKGNKIYSKVIQDGESGYVLIKDNCMWSWGWGSYQGTKMCFEGNIWDMSETVPMEAEYHCLPAVFPDSQFDPPANIDFMDTAEMSPRDEEILKILPPPKNAESSRQRSRKLKQCLKTSRSLIFLPQV